jgi:hypothetical protein
MRHALMAPAPVAPGQHRRGPFPSRPVDRAQPSRPPVSSTSSGLPRPRATPTCVSRYGGIQAMRQAKSQGCHSGGRSSMCRSYSCRAGRSRPRRSMACQGRLSAARAASWRSSSAAGQAAEAGAAGRRRRGRATPNDAALSASWPCAAAPARPLTHVDGGHVDGAQAVELGRVLALALRARACVQVRDPAASVSQSICRLLDSELAGAGAGLGKCCR